MEHVQPYQSRSARARSLTAKALFDDQDIYPYFLTRLGNKFSNTFPSVPSGGVEPLTLGK